MARRKKHAIGKVQRQQKGKHSDDCFVISSIGQDLSHARDHADQVFSKLIVPALTKHGYDPKRIDQRPHSARITDKIVERLANSSLCIALLSPSSPDVNPNVMYEVGIRHAWHLPLIPLAEKGTKLPFDIKDFNTIFFELGSTTAIKKGIRELAQRVVAIRQTVADKNFRTSPGQLDVFGDAMRCRAGRYALDTLYVIKIDTLKFLCKTLRRIRLELEKDYESDNAISNPLEHHADILDEEFNHMANRVDFLEEIANSCNHEHSRRHCKNVLEQMKRLQRDGWKVVSSWRRNTNKAGFMGALRGLDALIQKTEAIVDGVR